jgi:hypothetical protein
MKPELDQADRIPRLIGGSGSQGDDGIEDAISLIANMGDVIAGLVGVATDRARSLGC